MNTLQQCFRDWRKQMLDQIRVANNDPTATHMLCDMLEQARRAVHDRRTLRYARTYLNGKDPRKAGAEGLEACVCAYADPKTHKDCRAAHYRRHNPALWVSA